MLLKNQPRKGLSSALKLYQKAIISWIPLFLIRWLKTLMNKLDLQSTMELVRFAAKLGIIDVNLWKG